MSNIHILCSLLTVVFFITIMFMLMTTNNVVEQNEYAVVVNSFTMKFYDNILTQGFYVRWPGDTFIKFERTLQNIDLGVLNCLTKDEVMLEIYVSAQYQYDKNKLISVVLKQFNTNGEYSSFLKSIMRSAVLNTCLEFTVLEYYEKRSQVDVAMFNEIQREVNGRHIGSNVEYFQLTDITYPPEYISILHDKQNTLQTIVIAKNNRETSIVKATTKTLENERNANINIINANNYYNITIYNANAQKEAIVKQWENRKELFSNIVSDLNLTIQQLIDYLKSNIVMTSQLYSSI